MKKYIKKQIIALLGCAMMAGNARTQETDSLSRYLEIAEQSNPALKAAFHIYEASLQNALQAGAYEDPRLEAGFFPQPMELVEGREIARFQVMQMFPWFGVRKAAQTEARHMTRMAFEQIREARENLFLEIYTQWYALCALQQKWKTTEENISLLKQLETLALQKYAAGKNFSGSSSTNDQSSTTNAFSSSASDYSMQGMNMSGNPAASVSASSGSKSAMDMGGTASGLSEILRIQLEIAEVESDLESVQSEIVAGKARFNTLLNRPVENEVFIPDKLLQTPFSLNMKSSIEQMAMQNAMLEMIREETLAYKAKEKMNRKMSYPMWGIGLQYMWIGKKMESASHTTAETGMENKDNGMNGKDMWMPMVSVSLPVFRNKYKAAQQESKRLQQANEEKYADTFNRLQAELYQYRHQLDDAARKIVLYKKQTGLARTTYDLLVQEFTSGKTDLKEVIQIQRQWTDYRWKETESIANYNTIVISIQKLMSNISK
ncbi:MAG: TolC family protein [Candidatus Azobacteroides sp.]|nr:TolC family protein [Candidatus Azobacteroides sp.]